VYLSYKVWKLRALLTTSTTWVKWRSLGLQRWGRAEQIRKEKQGVLQRNLPIPQDLLLAVVYS
jgi:hypothetical protein